MYEYRFAYEIGLCSINTPNFSQTVLMQVENILSTYEPHACVVVYSIVDR